MASDDRFTYPLPDLCPTGEPCGVPPPYGVFGVHDGVCDTSGADGGVSSSYPLFPLTEIDYLGRWMMTSAYRTWSLLKMMIL